MVRLLDYGSFVLKVKGLWCWYLVVLPAERRDFFGHIGPLLLFKKQ